VSREKFDLLSGGGMKRKDRRRKRESEGSKGRMEWLEGEGSG